MKTCPKCGAQVADDAGFCTVCGFNFNAAGAAAGAAAQGAPQGAPQPQYQQPQYQQAPVAPNYDHTAEFDAKDISDNKVVAMVVYLLGTLGVIIAAILAGDSKYAGFHVRQSLKLTVCNLLVYIIGALLCWTIIVPIAAGVCFIILFVVRIICFFNVCGGKAIEPAIVRGLGFLK